mmetsp:Transcript_27759/g.36387  ORF Transcript_27759/g.36387 Transcript_27759/m.36387 type:complete len:445 (-) Transcript_27759:90-1424(-)|eukprot:CAMPEP_0117756084 /NCGR_PEP_ID=MMETSP0947-20121206/13843_1 /TAXON_ID=44440 /ORGANISM="Chattonella subsalsa, Strain CCMP2191" /LENGTH=444 /DNA_ID=CAMNT_0005575555 /DNA_START=15 /DNA_END=1349 /DNA_ORIENTATION=-
MNEDGVPQPKLISGGKEKQPLVLPQLKFGKPTKFLSKKRFLALKNSKIERKSIGEKLVYSICEEAKQYRETFEKLQLSEEEVHHVFLVFGKIMKQDQNFVTQSELLQYLEMDNSKFMSRVFRNFDIGKSKKIGFKDFLIASWNYCTMSHASLVIFAFDTYDTKNHGYINEDDLKDLVSDVFGSHFERNAHAVKIFEKLDKMCLEQQDYGINIDQFTAFTAKHPNMLFPAYAVQNKLREKIVGQKFWKKQAKKRVGMSENGSPLSIDELLKAQVHLPTFYDVAQDKEQCYNDKVQDVMLVSGLKEKRYREWKAQMRALKEKQRLEKEALAAIQKGPEHLTIGGVRVDNRKNYKEGDKYQNFLKKNEQPPAGSLAAVMATKRAAGHFLAIRNRKEENRIRAEEKQLKASEKSSNQCLKSADAPASSTTVMKVQILEVHPAHFQHLS